MKKIITLYVETEREAGVDCSLSEFLKEIEILDYEVRAMTKERGRRI